MSDVKWHRSQREIIEAAPSARLHVSAGPGTGKTAVACARVAWLVGEDLAASNIWLISFTRTAVNEIRDRIAEYMENDADAFTVKIATLDSHAWTIHSGFDEDAKILGSYEENIKRVLDLVRSNTGVSEYLEQLEHLIVDEAQDIVGMRSDLLAAFIEKLSDNCGVTVFADEAQAIYGFADDREVEESEDGEQTLAARIKHWTGKPFDKHDLEKVYRTDSKKLKKIFTKVRRTVLSSPDKQTHLKDVVKKVERYAHESTDNKENERIRDMGNDAFVLYRRRADVLQRSSYLVNAGVPHRIRMSGLPQILTPWIGMVLADYTEARLTQKKFEMLWEGRVPDDISLSEDCYGAWARLVRLAGVGRRGRTVSMRDLRNRLGRRRPPVDLCSPELGDNGPIIGTIHASKGREANTVHLMIPPNYSGTTDQEEEARVIFVGATRARSKLLSGSSYRGIASKLESGRAYRVLRKRDGPRAQVEIGLEGDVTAEGLAGRSVFASADEVQRNQNLLRMVGAMLPLKAKSDPDTKFLYRFGEIEEGPCLGILSNEVNSDLFKIAKDVKHRHKTPKLRPPNFIPFLHLWGLRTIVLPPESPECERLHEPWSQSGVLLAPLILGYPTISFPKRKSHSWKK